MEKFPREKVILIPEVDTDVVSEVAIALLPCGVDIGDRLKFEDYEFIKI